MIINIIITRRSNPRRVVQINTGRRLPPQDCRQRHSRQTTKVIVIINTVTIIVINTVTIIVIIVVIIIIIFKERQKDQFVEDHGKYIQLDPRSQIYPCTWFGHFSSILIFKYFTRAFPYNLKHFFPLNTKRLNRSWSSLIILNFPKKCFPLKMFSQNIFPSFICRSFHRDVPSPGRNVMECQVAQ